jgi:hypothetical protein
MMRKFLYLLLTVFLLVTVSIGEAQQPKKVFRIGYLSNRDPARESDRAEAIRRALRELGYIEGQNIAIDYRYAEGKQDRYPEGPASTGSSPEPTIMIGIVLVAFLAARIGADPPATTIISTLRRTSSAASQLQPLTT